MGYLMDPVALQCSTWAPGSTRILIYNIGGGGGLPIRYFLIKKFGISRSRDLVFLGLGGVSYF